MKEAFNKFRVASTGRWAISLRTYVLTVPFAILMNVERENLLNPGNAARSFAICMAGELASWLFLFIAHMTLLKDRRKHQQSFFKCLSVWFGAGAIKGASFVLYAVWVFGLEPDFQVRMVMPTLFTGATTALLAFYFGSIDRRRIENSALIAIDGFLETDIQELYIAERKARVDAVKSLRMSLEPEISTLRNIAQGLSVDFYKIESRDTLNEILRQSRELESRIDAESKKLSVMRFATNQINFLEDKKSIFFGLMPQVISVRTSAVFITLGMFSGQITRNGSMGVASGLVGVTFVATVLFILRKISLRLQGLKLLITIIASYPVVFLLQVIHVAYLSPAFFDLPNPYLPWYSGLKTIYGYYLASIVAGLMIRNSDKLIEARESHQILQRQIETMNRNQDLISEHILKTRFGTITGKIAGVTMALQLILNENSDTLDQGAKNKVMAGAIQLLVEANKEIELLDIEFQYV